LGEEDEDIPLDSYLCDDDEDSDLSDEGDNGGAGMSLMGAENTISAKDLIDNNLTELLNTMKKFPKPTET